MPLQIPQDFWLARLEFRRTGVSDPQIMTFSGGSDDPSLDAAEVAAAIDTAWSAASSFKSILTADTSHIQTHVLLNVGGQITVGDTAGTGAGSAGATALQTPAVAPIIRKNTNLAGRKFRGRTHFPSIVESAVDNAGVIASGTLTAMNTACTNFRSSLTAVQLILALLHTDSTLPTNLSSLSTAPFVGTVRNRQPRL